MPGPESPTEKTFKFIDDPGHKENLSGRVRAACMTCRRKKIKCSGELNCRTCREKGIVCEGLPERRRPTRDSSHAVTKKLAPVEAKKRKAEDHSSAAVASKRPKIDQEPAASEALNSSKDDFVPHPSVMADRSEQFLSPLLSAPEPPSVNVKITYKHASKPSRALHVDSWQLRDEQPYSKTPKQSSEPTSHMYRDQLNQDGLLSGVPIESVRPAQALVDWATMQEPGPIWRDAPTEQPDNLAAISRALNSSTQDATSRRQSIAFPLPLPESALEQQRDPFAGGGGAYDDIATLLYTRTGMTPGPNELSGWLGADPDFTQLLVQPSSQSIRPTHSVSPQTESVVLQPQNLSDVFGRWPNWPNE